VSLSGDPPQVGSAAERAEPSSAGAGAPRAGACDEGTGTAVGELGYVEAAGELDGIIAELDRGVVDVDVLEERLCRAVEIVEELDRRIRGARERVNSILPRLEMAARGSEGAPPEQV
jgi:exonuclease VII small subunit